MKFSCFIRFHANTVFPFTFVMALALVCSSNCKQHEHSNVGDSRAPQKSVHKNSDIVGSDPVVELKRSDRVAIELQWIFKNLPPGMKVEHYEVSAQRPVGLWETGSHADLKKIPVSIPVPGDGKTIIMNPGSKKLFVLVVRNPTSQTLHFFASPHRTDPDEASLGFKFKCLCVNHAFTIPPGEIWYRIVELKLAPNFLGDQLLVTHSIIGLTDDRVSGFQGTDHGDHH